MSLVAHQEGGISLFHLFEVVSDMFAPSARFYFLQATTSQNVLTCKFTTNQLKRVTHFGNLLLYSLNTLTLGIFEKLKFCYNQKKKEITIPTTDVSA